jgi:hypothetical protein
MRARWACPDLGEPKPDGFLMPVPGSQHEFPDCPTYYLRTADMGLPAVHLLDDVDHPARLVSQWGVEIRNGARLVDSVSPRARELVHLYLVEQDAAQEHERERRREEASRGRR